VKNTDDRLKEIADANGWECCHWPSSALVHKFRVEDLEEENEKLKTAIREACKALCDPEVTNDTVWFNNVSTTMYEHLAHTLNEDPCGLWTDGTN